MQDTGGGRANIPASEEDKAGQGEDSGAGPGMVPSVGGLENGQDADGNRQFGQGGEQEAEPAEPYRQDIANSNGGETSSSREAEQAALVFPHDGIPENASAGASAVLQRLDPGQLQEFCRQREVALQRNGSLTPDYEIKLAALIESNFPRLHYGYDLERLNRLEDAAIHRALLGRPTSGEDRDGENQIERRAAPEARSLAGLESGSGHGGLKEDGAYAGHEEPHRPGALQPFGHDAGRDTAKGLSVADREAAPARPAGLDGFREPDHREFRTPENERGPGRAAGESAQECSSLAEKQQAARPRDIAGKTAELPERQREGTDRPASITDKIAAKELDAARDRKSSASPAKEKAEAMLSRNSRQGAQTPEKSERLTPERLQAWLTHYSEKRAQLKLPEPHGQKRELARLAFRQNKARNCAADIQAKELQLLNREQLAERVGHSARYLARDMNKRGLPDAARYEGQSALAFEASRGAKEQRKALRQPSVKRTAEGARERQGNAALAKQAEGQARSDRSGLAASERGSADKSSSSARDGIAPGETAPVANGNRIATQGASRIEAQERALFGQDRAALTADRLQRMLTRYDELRKEQRLPSRAEELSGKQDLAARQAAESRALAGRHVQETTLLSYQHQAERTGVAARWLGTSLKERGMPEAGQYAGNMRRAFHIARFCWEGRAALVDRWQTERLRPRDAENRASWRSAERAVTRCPTEGAPAEKEADASRAESRRSWRPEREGKLRSKDAKRENGLRTGRASAGRGGGRGR